MQNSGFMSVRFALKNSFGIKWLLQIAHAMLLGVGLLFASVSATAAVINVTITPLGGGSPLYSATLEVVNDGSPAVLGGFTVYLDENLYANTLLTAAPSTWDTLLIPPDLGIPAAGFLDAFVIDPGDALQLGGSQGGFSFTFDYLGQGLPAAMPFDINDENFNVLFSGDARLTVNAVPEPATALLMLLPLAVIAGGRPRRQRFDPTLPDIGTGAPNRMPKH